MFRCLLVARKKNSTGFSIGLTGRSKNLDPTGFHLWSSAYNFIPDQKGLRQATYGGKDVKLVKKLKRKFSQNEFEKKKASTLQSVSARIKQRRFVINYQHKFIWFWKTSLDQEPISSSFCWSQPFLKK